MKRILIASIFIIFLLLGIATFTQLKSSKSQKNNSSTTDRDSITYIGVVYDGSERQKKDSLALNRILRLIEEDNKVNSAIEKNDSLRAVIGRVKDDNLKKDKKIKKLEKHSNLIPETEKNTNIIASEVPGYVKDSLQTILKTTSAFYEIDTTRTVVARFNINEKGEAVNIAASGGTAKLQEASVRAIQIIDFSDASNGSKKVKLKIKFAPSKNN